MGMGGSGIRGDEPDPGVDAGGLLARTGDHAQPGPAVGRSHVDPAKPDVDVCVEPLLEPKLFEQLHCRVLIGNGDRHGRDPAEGNCIFGHAW
jgi:hypothetical protein